MSPSSTFAISIVTYHPNQAELSRLAETLIEELASLRADLGSVTIRILDNSEDSGVLASLHGNFAWATGDRLNLDIAASRANLGFGAGHNANVAKEQATFILFLNQDIEIEPGVLSALLDTAQADEPQVAAWEMRQIPYEHPKDYDPVRLDTCWVSGAATLFRREAFNAVGGFDSNIFMYGEDVDLSWRLRAAGWRLRYLPRCAVVHRTYAVPGEIKRMQVLGGTLTNLCLRARYGGG